MRRLTFLIGLLVFIVSSAYANDNIVSHWTWSGRTISAQIILPQHLAAPDQQARLDTITVQQLDRSCAVEQKMRDNGAPLGHLVIFTCLNEQSPITILDLGVTKSSQHHLSITRGLQLPISQHIITEKYPRLRVKQGEEAMLDVSRPKTDMFYGGVDLGHTLLLSSLLGLFTIASLLFVSPFSDKKILALFGLGLLLGFTSAPPDKMSMSGLQFLLGILIALRASFHTLVRQRLWPYANIGAIAVLVLVVLSSGASSTLDLAFWAGAVLFLTALLFDAPPHDISLGGLSVFIGTIIGLWFLGHLRLDIGQGPTHGQVDIFALLGNLGAILSGFIGLFLVVKLGHGIFNAFRPARVNVYRDTLGSFLFGYGVYVAALGFFALL